jgi:hypothetical protein
MLHALHVYTLKEPIHLRTYTNMHTYDLADWFSDTARNFVYLRDGQSECRPGTEYPESLRASPQALQ